MSKTLRRPMFRGGRVSSYGTGIASGLADGGMPPKRGLVTGPGGYQGIVDPMRFRFPNKQTTGGDLMSMNRDQALKLAELYGPSSIDPSFYSTNSFKPYIPTTVTDEDTTKEIEIDDYNYIPKRAVSDVSEGLDESWAVDKEEEGPEWHEDIYIDEKGILQHKKPLEIPEIPKDPNLEKIAKLQAIIDAKEEPTELDAKTAVAENKALFADLLGIKEARGQDISDMLLGFAGTEGDTTMEKFQRFAATEAQRPGRRRKIQDAAGTLAIQDYIAGKKSKDALKLMMAQEDYRPKAKLKGMMPSLDDTAQIALAKFASLNDSKSSSDSTIKDFIKFKTGENVFRNDKIKKIDDVEKKKNKLKIGYNIIEEDGIKIFVKWDGTNYNILTLNEIWAGR
jgi:hypothetical protein